jgi:xylulose-5-phosphate/fructose-6-phosphate phosphoketolase
LNAKNYVNLMVGSKQPTPVWLSPEEAHMHCVAGASVWKFASTDEGVEPDVYAIPFLRYRVQSNIASSVLVGIGVEVTFEVIAAAALLKKEVPHLRVRVVNVTDLMVLSPEMTHPHALKNGDFKGIFTEDKPIHFNYHGYTSELKGLLFGRPNLDRITVNGYNEEGWFGVCLPLKRKLI